MPANRLVCELALQTGWRIDDILCLTSEQLRAALQKKRHTVTIREAKTGKTSTRSIPVNLLREVCEQSGKLYAFQGRDDWRKHRTRQAVYLDLKRAAKRFNIKLNLSPHSLRKNYAVYLRQQGYSLSEIQKRMNHDNLVVTMLYALSDELGERYGISKKPRT
jgi:site-specific recombinase XerD